MEIMEIANTDIRRRATKTPQTLGLVHVSPDARSIVFALYARGGSETNQSTKMKKQRRYYYGVWPIKCRQGSKTNKSNCQFWKKPTYNKLVDNGFVIQFCQVRNQRRQRIPWSLKLQTLLRPYVSLQVQLPNAVQCLPTCPNMDHYSFIEKTRFHCPEEQRMMFNNTLHIGG